MIWLLALALLLVGLMIRMLFRSQLVVGITIDRDSLQKHRGLPAARQSEIPDSVTRKVIPDLSVVLCIVRAENRLRVNFRGPLDSGPLQLAHDFMLFKLR